MAQFLYKEVTVRRGFRIYKSGRKESNIHRFETFDSENKTYTDNKFSSEEHMLNTLGMEGWVLRCTSIYASDAFVYTKYNFGKNMSV